uniref:DUF4806 domain-containing protein n=1 Tax=Anopheles coluzzii TaxID=1518534 RepID=A0A6E8VN33_ANOCL
MATQRDKKTGNIYKIRDKLESKFDEEFEAEQNYLRLKREQEAKTKLTSELLLTCEEQDPFADVGEPTIENVFSLLTTVLQHIGQLNRKVDHIQKEVEDVSIRVLRVEKKLGTTLATLEQLKDVVSISDLAQKSSDPELAGFEFNAVSNEEELNELDFKLGADAEYQGNLTKWLNVKIVSEDSKNRLHEAMEIVFKRDFLPKCSWKGRSKPEPKIPMSAQRNIMELFRVVGSNRFTTITDAFVAKFFQKKLPYAKNRVHLQRNQRKGCRLHVKKQPDTTVLQHLAGAQQILIQCRAEPTTVRVSDNCRIVENA